MPSITIYGGAAGSSFRPHWMLAELGLSYETKKVDMQKGENRSPEYLSLNPTGQIPTMVYDDFVLTESAAIVHYLAEKHGQSFFGPATPESHAEMLRWQLFILLNVDRNFVALCYPKWGMPSTPEKETAAREALAKYLPIFDAQLVGKEYILGTDFSVADVVTRSSFEYAQMAEVDLSAYPAIKAWADRCAARPAFIKAKG